MSSKLTSGIIVGAVILSTTVLAEYVYLKKVFEGKYSSDKGSVAATAGRKGSKTDTDYDSGLAKKLKEMEIKHDEALSESRAKGRQIAELERKLKRTAQYAKVTLMSIEGAESGLSGSSAASSLAYSSRAEVAAKLEAFALQFSDYLDEESLEEFNSEFGSLVDSLKSDATTSVAARKTNMLASLQEEIAGTENKRYKEKLQRKLDAVENASEADLPGVLDYYQRLDDIKELNKLMKKYSIAREELRTAGIEPPPRSDWGPDILEVAMNLENYTSMYSPLVPAEKREKFEQDFSSYLNELTKPMTKSEARKTKSEWGVYLQKEYAKATDERHKKHLEYKMKELEKASLNDVTKYSKYLKMGELNKLTDEYDMSRSELIQGGVLIGGGRRGHGRWRNRK